MKEFLHLLPLIGMVGIFSIGGLVQAAEDHGKFGDIQAVSGVGVLGTEKEQEDKLLHIIKNAINWVLGILGLIALVLCLYAGFQMTTAMEDTKKFDTGKTIMKHAGIGLAIIALSWMIVSIIFWFIDKSTNTVVTT
jgi:hypothetical protein